MKLPQNRLFLFCLILLFFSLVANAETTEKLKMPHEREDLNEQEKKKVERVIQQTNDFSKAENFENMQGGAGTSRKLVNQNAFSNPSANLSFEEQQKFALGNALFRKIWVSSPSSTTASDGLGPLFNARSCQSCHIKDGRGSPPTKKKKTPFLC